MSMGTKAERKVTMEGRLQGSGTLHELNNRKSSLKNIIKEFKNANYVKKSEKEASEEGINFLKRAGLKQEYLDKVKKQLEETGKSYKSSDIRWKRTLLDSIPRKRINKS